MKGDVITPRKDLTNPRLARRFRRQNAHLAEAANLLPRFQAEELSLSVEVSHIIQIKPGLGSGLPGSYHAHPYLELTFISGSPVHYRTRDDIITVKQDQVFLMPPRISHRWDAGDGTSSLFGFMIELSNKGQLRHLNAFEDSVHRTHSCLTPLPGTLHMRDLILQEVSSRTCRPRMVAPLLQALITMVVQQLVDAFIGHPALNSDLSDPHQLFSRARTYIEANLAQRPTVDEVAEFVGLSRRQLLRIFASQGARPPKDYITERSVERARALLAEGYSVKAAACELGFKDAAYFSRFFKHSTGQSPSDT